MSAPSNIAVVTPSGGYDVVGYDTGGRVENVLPRTKANRLGFRPDYKPNVPDLAGIVRDRVKHIVAERRAESEHQLRDVTRRAQRRLE